MTFLLKLLRGGEARSGATNRRGWRLKSPVPVMWTRLEFPESRQARSRRIDSAISKRNLQQLQDSDERLKGYTYLKRRKGSAVSQGGRRPTRE
jgi:hypothetical protein